MKLETSMGGGLGRVRLGAVNQRKGLKDHNRHTQPGPPQESQGGIFHPRGLPRSKVCGVLFGRDVLSV